MSSKKELQLAYGLACVLLVVGIVSYAYTAFSAKPPDEPVRIMYKSAAGKVLFDHKTHTADAGYGVSCFDCHHHPEGDETALRACGDCHTPEMAEGQVAESCLECHDADEVEGTEVMQKADAFHGQCVSCHQQAGAGPVDCNSCHVL
jgi:hypothetical protein